MDVSILGSAPGRRQARRLLSTMLLLQLLAVAASWSAPAAAFTLFRFSSGASVQLDPEDIQQGGASLGPGSDQSFGQGTLPVELTDFSQPLDMDLAGPLGGFSLNTRLFSNLAFAIRLSNQERNQCLNSGDFEISLRMSTPSGGLESAALNGGRLGVSAFEPIFRGALGNSRCPGILLYGFSLDLSLEDAVADGDYRGESEIIVERLGGGQAQTAQVTLEVGVPSITLLYHPDRVRIDLRAVAIAGLLGAGTSCGTDGCLDLGAQRFDVNALGQPIPVNVQDSAVAFAPVQTVTLQNAVAVRATGCSGNTYTSASYQIVNPTGGIQPGAGNIGGLLGASCGLDFRYGDLSFDLDLAQASNANATATIQITVTGI